MKNLNVTIKTVLDMFGESERCIMHKNTAPVDVIEKFMTNEELDQLIGKYPDE